MQDKSSKMKISIYTYWKLAKPQQFKQLQNTAPQTLIDGANISTAMWLYNIVLSENLASWILDPWSSNLETRSSRLETRSARIESQVSSFECQLTFERYCTVNFELGEEMKNDVINMLYLPTLMPAGWKLRSHAGSRLRANFSRLIEKCELLPSCLTQFPKIS